jgi:hypothetical protein
MARRTDIVAVSSPIVIPLFPALVAVGIRCRLVWLPDEVKSARQHFFDFVDFCFFLRRTRQ